MNSFCYSFVTLFSLYVYFSKQYDRSARQESYSLFSLVVGKGDIWLKEEKGIVTVKQQTSKVMTKVQEPNELDVPKKETFDVMISPKLASSLQAVSKTVKSDIIEFREFSEKNQ